MFKETNHFRKIYIAYGYRDLRNGIDGLASIIQHDFSLNLFKTDILFLFCGRKPARMKGLVWEGDGFLLLYQRLEEGRFQRPRNTEELENITEEQYQWLLKGLSIKQTKTIRDFNTEVPDRLLLWSDQLPSYIYKNRT